MTPERESYLKDLAISGRAQSSEVRELLTILEERVNQAKHRGVELGLAWGSMGVGCADPEGYRKVFADIIVKADTIK